MENRNNEYVQGAPSVPPAANDTHLPEFTRLPRAGQAHPLCALNRSAINALILPTEANGCKPPVRSFVLRQKGKARGIRLINTASLLGYLRSVQAQAEQAGQVRTEGGAQ